MRRVAIPIFVLLLSLSLFSTALIKPELARAGLIEEMLAIGSDNLSKYSMQLFGWGVNAVVQGLTGYDGSGQVAYNPNADLTAVLGKSLVTLAMSPPPIHTKDFFVNKALADNLLAPRSGFAQTGGDLIKGQPGDPWIFDLIWKNMRNISYSFVTLVIVLTGLLVMLSYKTDPRTTLSLIDFVPKLAMSLIIITFSWPIAGIFVDLTTVLANVGYNLLGGYGDFNLLLGATIGGGLVAALGGILLTIFTAGIGVAVGVGGVVIGVILLIVGIAYIIALISAFVTLIKRWISMVLLAAFAPIIFLWGSLPNQEEALQGWFKSMLVSALTFPAAGLLLYLATKLTPTIGKSFPIPPLEYPIIGGGSILLPLLSPIVSVVMVFMISAIPSVLEEYIDVKAPRALGDVGKQMGKMAASLPFIGSAMK